MDTQKDGLTVRHKDRLTDGHIHGQMDRRTYICTDRETSTDKWTNGRMDSQTDTRKDGQMDISKDRWIDGHIHRKRDKHGQMDTRKDGLTVRHKERWTDGHINWQMDI